MSDENTNPQENITEAAPVTTVAPVKRGRGRPPGSKNKPKDPNATPKAKAERVKKEAPAVAAKPAPVVAVSKAFIAADDDVEESSVDNSVEE